MKRQTVIFLHIPKTAGTTLFNIAERHYDPTAYFIIDNTPEQVASFRATSAERLSELRFVGGHIPFGVHDWLPQPATYITFLRQPVALINSYYHYVRSTLGHANYHVAQTQTFEQFTQFDSNMRNPQTRMLAGVSAENCTEADLEMAKANLQQYFSVIGLTERFDESLLLIADLLQWRDIHHARMNVNRKKKTPDAHHVAIIEQANQLDLRLYAFASTLFEQMIAQQDGEFARRVEQFRHGNRRNYWRRAKSQWLHQRRTLPGRAALRLQDLRVRVQNRLTGKR